MVNSKLFPLLIGGLIPAFLYGFAGVLQKLTAKQGGNVATYLVGFGMGTLLLGLVYGELLGRRAGLGQPILIAIVSGTLFAVGAGLISLVILRFDAAISQLSPLYNMNVLVTAILGLLLFAELEQLSAPQLLLGTVLILAGGWLVSAA